MAGFTKLWSTIVHSTVWQEPLHVKVVWITMLALADARGYVGASIPGLAKAAGVTVEQCEEALNKFLSPDEYSRTKEHDGRRIEDEEGGWRLLNYERHREGRSEEERRAQNRAAQKRHREKLRAARTPKEKEKKRTPSPPAPAKSPPQETWIQEGLRWWTGNVGAIQYGRYGTALKPFVDKYGWEKVKLALEKYVNEMKAAGKPMRVEWFAAEGIARLEDRRAPVSREAAWEKEKREAEIARSPRSAKLMSDYRATLLADEAEAWWEKMKEYAKAENRHPTVVAVEWITQNIKDERVT